EREQRPVAELILLEEHFVKMQRDELGRRAGSARGEEIDLVEDLEGEDGAEYERYHDCRTQQRQHHLGDELPARCAVDARRLERFEGQGLDRSEQDKEYEWHPVPNVDHDHR